MRISEEEESEEKSGQWLGDISWRRHQEGCWEASPVPADQPLARSHPCIPNTMSAPLLFPIATRIATEEPEI